MLRGALLVAVLAGCAASTPGEVWSKFHVSAREDVAIELVGSSTGCGGQIFYPAAGDANSQLPIIFGSNGQGCTTTVALRFTQVSLPRGAKIRAASLTFDSFAPPCCPIKAPYNKLELYTDTNVAVSADNTPNSAPLNKVKGSLSCRQSTLASATWTPDTWRHHGEYSTSDIANVIQAVVGQSGWREGNAVTLLFRTSGKGARLAQAFREGKPSLNVAWEGTEALGKYGCANAVANAHAQQCMSLHSTGYVNTSSESLDLGYSVRCPPDQPNNLVALRFDNVMIPRGATVQSAQMQLIARPNGLDLHNLRLTEEDGGLILTFQVDCSVTPCVLNPRVASGEQYGGGTVTRAVRLHRETEIMPLVVVPQAPDGWGPTAAVYFSAKSSHANIVTQGQDTISPVQLGQTWSLDTWFQPEDDALQFEGPQNRTLVSSTDGLTQPVRITSDGWVGAMIDGVMYNAFRVQDINPAFVASYNRLTVVCDGTNMYWYINYVLVKTLVIPAHFFKVAIIGNNIWQPPADVQPLNPAPWGWIGGLQIVGDPLTEAQVLALGQGTAAAYDIWGKIGHIAEFDHTVPFSINALKPLSAVVPWQVPVWRTSEYISTPDIKAVIQQIVSAPDWTPGNPIVILIDGTNPRVIESNVRDTPALETFWVMPDASTPNKLAAVPSAYKCRNVSKFDASTCGRPALVADVVGGTPPAPATSSSVGWVLFIIILLAAIGAGAYFQLVYRQQDTKSSPGYIGASDAPVEASIYGTETGDESL